MSASKLSPFNNDHMSCCSSLASSLDYIFATPSAADKSVTPSGLGGGSISLHSIGLGALVMGAALPVLDVFSKYHS